MNLHQELHRLSTESPQPKIEKQKPRRQRRAEARAAAKAIKVARR